MRFSYARMRNLLAGLAVGLAVVGCGSATNNDQGASFTLLGYFAALPSSGATDLPVQLTGLSILLSDSDQNETPPSGNNLGSGTVLAVVGIQSNLVAQAIRTDQVFFEYNIPGASAQPPTTNYALSMTLGPATSATTAPSSSLPGGFTGLSNRAFAQVPVIPAEIRQWMSLNRNSLPERPFVMTVRTVVTGVGTAGDRWDTNAADLFVQVNDDTIISPTEGTPPSESDTNGEPGAL